MVTNGNFIFLLTSCFEELQFHIPTYIYWRRMAISPSYWHVVVNIANFTLILTSSAQEWQFHIATESSGEEWQFHIPADI